MLVMKSFAIAMNKTQDEKKCFSAFLILLSFLVLVVKSLVEKLYRSICQDKPCQKSTGIPVPADSLVVGSRVRFG